MNHLTQALTAVWFRVTWPDEDGMGLAVDIACSNSQHRYELVEVAQKFFKRIGIAGEHSGNFIHLDVSPYKTQDVIWAF